MEINGRCLEKDLDEMDLDELDELEDEEEERILLQMRMQRMAEMKALQAKSKYGIQSDNLPKVTMLHVMCVCIM